MAEKTHAHQPIKGLDAVNFPARTEGGPQRTDEYTVETPEGFIRPKDEGEDDSATLAHSSSIDKEKALDIKLVTFTEGDPEDPKNLPLFRKWCVPRPYPLLCVVGSDPGVYLLSLSGASRPRSLIRALLSLWEAP